MYISCEIDWVTRISYLKNMDLPAEHGVELGIFMRISSRGCQTVIATTGQIRAGKIIEFPSGSD